MRCWRLTKRDELAVLSDIRKKSPNEFNLGKGLFLKGGILLSGFNRTERISPANYSGFYLMKIRPKFATFDLSK